MDSSAAGPDQAAVPDAGAEAPGEPAQPGGAASPGAAAVESREPVDVLIVSLGSTGGLRAADAELAGSLRRAGATVALAAAVPPRRPLPTFALTDLAWARAARRAAIAALAEHRPRAVVYSSTTAALLWPRPGAIRFDAPSAGNRPGRHGLWQRPLEHRRLARAPLLLPWSEGGLREAPATARAGARALVLPVPVEPSGPSAPVRDIAAITYAANPAKKGLDRVFLAWLSVRRPGEELLVAGAESDELDRADIPLPPAGVRLTGMLPPGEYRALLRRARVFVCAPRREDYGLAQLEALADGCQLVTTPAPGPYAALPIARALDPRLVSDDLGAALRAALDDPTPDYAVRAALAPFRRAAIDRLVREELLPRLLPGSAA
ncbi:MAG TPA: glycosyltransferase [Solirubrobacteraceae bacterium]|nr:glycosyltransferase [Solirubrobacteraceae bacterium]